MFCLHVRNFGETGCVLVGVDVGIASQPASGPARCVILRTLLSLHHAFQSDTAFKLIFLLLKC